MDGPIGLPYIIAPAALKFFILPYGRVHFGYFGKRVIIGPYCRTYSYCRSRPIGLGLLYVFSGFSVR